jgi:hypothetical protein
MRFVLACVTLAILTGVAHAEGMLPNGAELKVNKLFIQDEDGDFREPPTPDDRRFYVNFAHCACSKANAGVMQKLRYEIQLTNTTGTSNRPVEVWVGNNCNDDVQRPMMCRKIDVPGLNNLDALVTATTFELSLFDVINGFDTAGTCKTIEGDAKIWLLVDADGTAGFEYYKIINIPATDTAVDIKTIDTLAPPLPTGFRASSGEESIEISWTPPTGGNKDIFYYQALCIDDKDEPVGGPDPRYQTTDLLCGLPQGIALMEAQADGAGGTPLTEVPVPFQTLDVNYVCGEATATASSLTIHEVDNGRAYKVALLVIDQYGNVNGVYFNRTVIPQPVTDLWEDLHDRNSAVDGGCLLSQTYGEGNPLTRVLRSFRDTTLARTAYGRALIRGYYATLGKIHVGGSIVLRVIAGIYLLPLVVIALLWHFLTLPGLFALIALFIWRRKLRVRARVLALACLLFPTIASADDLTPYWDTAEDSDASIMDIPDVTWHVGIRLGPYIPDIDLQAGENAITGKGPYGAMFGDYWLRNSAGTLEKHSRSEWQVLPMLDVDRVLWDGYGQFTVGGSIGYMQKSAYAYLDGTSEDEAMRERSKASRNTFRLIPTVATVGYRFTLLDDLYGIPVVPYVRGGLSYYMWWIKAPNGNVSKVCDEMSADGTCAKEDKAYGGSFGYQGAIGLAIRAERVDSDAAISMRNSGISHAGFYAEYQYAKVDGFGNEHKLSVGDNTWFAGVDFEF